MKANATKTRERGGFRVVEFKNPSGAIAFRVTGWTLDARRIRENYSSHAEAVARLGELEIQRDNLGIAARPVVTRLSADQVTKAELALSKLGVGRDEELILAVDHWIAHGRARSLVESPRLDEAVKAFETWLEQTPELRLTSKNNLRLRARMFSRSNGTIRLADISPEAVEAFLGQLKVSPTTRDNYKRGLSRLFSWCAERPRRWLVGNPCALVKVEMNEKAPPSILSLDECRALMSQAESFRDGRLAPYAAVTLFGGLRPFEARRLTWGQINFADKEIRLEGNQTKTGRARTVAMSEALEAWLRKHEGKPFFPANWRKDFDAIKSSIGYGVANQERPHLKPWPEDILRHTAASHFFRRTESYGKTAEQLGNSEAIIKTFYQGRVSSAESEQFWAIMPTGRARKIVKASFGGKAAAAR